MKENRRDVSVFRFFRYHGKKDYNSDKNAIRKLNRKIDGDLFHVVNLPVRCLIATQAYVNEIYINKIERYNPESLNDLPLIVKYKENYYVTDGHHRVANEVANGCFIVKVRVIDIDDNMIMDFPLLDCMI